MNYLCEKMNKHDIKEKYKVLIWGCGSSCDRLLNIINHNKVFIEAYIDTYNYGKAKNNKIIINPNQIRNYNYDFIFIASQYYKEIIDQVTCLGVSKDKIVNMEYILENETEIMAYYYMYINLKRSLELAKKNKVKVLMSGISYGECGIDENILKNTCVNLSISGQDIYYGYKIVEDIINYKKNEIDVEKVIINIPYYVLEYDLSRNSYSIRTHSIYKKLVTDTHNCKELSNKQKKLIDFLNTKKEFDICEEFIDKYKLSKKVVSDRKKDILKTTIKEKLENGKLMAERDYDKNYPLTVIENKKIFNSYIEYLIKKNIQPLILICPVSEYYYKNSNARIEKELNFFLEDLKKRHNISIINLFRDKRFTDEDFSDVSHLNSKGSRKLTKIINEIL